MWFWCIANIEKYAENKKNTFDDALWSHVSNGFHDNGVTYISWTNEMGKLYLGISLWNKHTICDIGYILTWLTKKSKSLGISAPKYAIIFLRKTLSK